MPFTQKHVQSADLGIFTESLGNPTDPAVLLIMGAMNPGLCWYDAFCEALVARGFFVIRYDHRDTGQSSVVDFAIHPYDMDDLTSDALAVLDGYGIAKAHIVGLSMGGYIGQILGARHGDRVLSLTLISTTVDHRPYMEATTFARRGEYDLPFPEERYLAYLKNVAEHPPTTPEGFAEARMRGWEVICGGPLAGADREALVAMLADIDAHSPHPASAWNHGPAVARSTVRTQLVQDIHVPTLIIHGENDPCFPVAHGERLHALIPDAKLVVVPGMGHMYTLTEALSLVDVIAGEILL
ncbi:MAG: alpha/beta hydrolase [Candidatus Yonathbacteria bacterium]|nr:alpha/beta hydrolase [Candidatus Yonathbacteria bacterium]NTW47734.1 alpha/beta hydrolase [Candidatus Yonathbacteria bacterium]